MNYDTTHMYKKISFVTVSRSKGIQVAYKYVAVWFCFKSSK